MLSRDIAGRAVISELFDRPYNYKIVSDDDEEFLADFEIESGQDVEFHATSEEADGFWEVNFTRENDNRVTGEGDQYRIFSTVLKIFGEFIKRREPRLVNFDAAKLRSDGDNESGRSNLYKAMVKKFAKNVGYDYRFDSGDVVDRFLLKRNKPKSSVNEVFDKTYNWKITKNDDNTYAVLFNTDDGKEVEFEADRFEGPRAEWQVAFTVDKQVKVTNTGDQFKIFGTVVEIFVDFINKKTPADVMIMADKSGEASRVKLYDRMIKTLDKKFSEYSVEKKSGDKSVMYTLYKKDFDESRINEVLDKTYDWKIDTVSADLYKASFVTDDGRNVSFTSKYFDALDLWTSMFNVDGLQDVTNKGDQFRIFATITEIFRDFIKRLNPGVVLSMADKEHGEATTSREKLYYRLFTTFSQNTNYRFSKNSTPGSTWYYLTQKDLKESTQLNELFDQPYRWRSQVWPGEYLAKFRTDNKQSVKFTAKEMPRKNSWEIDFTVDGKTSVTGEGDQYKIFATIVEILHNFVEKCNPRKFMFTAEKKASTQSRSKLYSRMVKKFAKNSGYELDQIELGVTTVYYLSKKPTQNND